jgi:SAM-dependent methyltransferase
MVKPEIQKNIWDRQQVRRIAAGFDTNKRRLDLIFGHIQETGRDRLPKDVRVLNIGIGNGYLEATLISNGFDTYSLDPSTNAIEAIYHKLGGPEGHFRAGSASAMPFEARFFDVVAMSEVIEHLDDDTLHGCFSELKRVLKSGGVFLGTCPDNEELSRETVTCPHCSETFHRVGHVRSFDVKSLHSLLSEHFAVKICSSIRGRQLNWKGLIMYWYNVFPFRLAQILKPSIRIPQHIGCHILFKVTNRVATES